jgi:1-aminocyclopropane-1-carboxylate deaminase
MDIINPRIQEEFIRIDPIENWLNHSTCTIDLLRLDLIHPLISGNKWFKLKLNFQQALKEEKQTIITFGGAYSNHIIATAAAAKQYNLKCVAYIRGDELNINSNKVLAYCNALGTKLEFVTRENYDKKDSFEFLSQIKKQHNNAFIIPEGGNNIYGVLGASEIQKYIPTQYDYICLSVGSGTTMHGLLSKINAKQKLIGFSPMKGGTYLKQGLMNNSPNNNNFEIIDQYHFGGFGKVNAQIREFISQFHEQYKIVLDPIYTAKMFLGIEDLSKNHFFNNNSKILCIHTGGMTGN